MVHHWGRSLYAYTFNKTCFERFETVNHFAKQMIQLIRNFEKLRFSYHNFAVCSTRHQRTARLIGQTVRFRSRSSMSLTDRSAALLQLEVHTLTKMNMSLPVQLCSCSLCQLSVSLQPAVDIQPRQHPSVTSQATPVFTYVTYLLF